MTIELMVLLAVWPFLPQVPELRIDLIGNAGVVLSDGTTSLLVDLPYESGAFGYMTYNLADVQPSGSVVSVITHHHRDHFDPELLLAHRDWRVIGPPSVVSRLPQARILVGDSVEVGSFTVVAVSSTHTPDHRSYRVRWNGRVLYFVGDTEDPASVAVRPRPDLLFVTPWLSCLLADSGREAFGVRSIAYHQRPDGSDRVCGPVEVLEQGTRLTLRSPAGQ